MISDEEQGEPDEFSNEKGQELNLVIQSPREAKRKMQQTESVACKSQHVITVVDMEEAEQVSKRNAEDLDPRGATKIT